MDSNLSPDTAMALLKAAQSQADNKIQNLKNKNQADSVDETAQDFEAMFITEMMKPMFEGLETDGLFGGGKTEEVFRGLMLQEYGKMIAKTGQLGIADSVKAEILKMQEAQSGETDG